MKLLRTPFTSSPASAVDQLVAETDNISLQRIDEAASVLRPSNLGATHGEHEFDALGEEQAAAWPAEAQVASRPPRVAAARVNRSAEEAGFAVQTHRDELESIRKAKEHAFETLMPFACRSPHDDARYWLSYGGLGLGDTVGVLGAAVSLGEIPELALGQALATGLAAVTAGLVGGELRRLAQAKSRQRDPDSLTDDERGYRRLFEGADAEVPMTKLAAYTALTVGVLITASIFALRASTEGSLAGIAFGCLAFATALASFISGYLHADEVADLLATYDRRYRVALRRHARASKARPIGQYAAADTEAASIEREYAHRGDAAVRKVEACKHRMLRRNPQVVGHGDAADTSTVNAVAPKPTVVAARPSRKAAA
jgi:hypothetical protein